MESDRGQLSHDAARAVWRRAAQLQSEAEQRLEERARRSQALVQKREDADGPLDAREVEEAAIEAGISADYVRIALAEIGASEGEPVFLGAWEQKGADLLLGAGRHTISLSRLIPAPLDAITAAILRSFPAHPCLLQTRDIHDLPGGGTVILFAVPKYDWAATANPPFVEKATMVGLRQVHVTVRPAAGQTGATEVDVSGDLYPSLRKQWWYGAGTVGVSGMIGGALGGGVGAAAVSGALVALPALAGFLVLGGLTAGAWRWMYRYYQKEVHSALEQTLAGLDAHVRAVARLGPTHFPNPLPAGEPPLHRLTDGSTAS